MDIVSYADDIALVIMGVNSVNYLDQINSTYEHSSQGSGLDSLNLNSMKRQCLVNSRKSNKKMFTKQLETEMKVKNINMKISLILNTLMQFWMSV